MSKGSPPGLRHEEIRFAVVLNGGVSLAVWMGGAVNEIDAVTRAGTAGASDDEWTRLAALLNVTARADVITGTSAGGINGAALALSQVNKRAEVSMLRDLWAEQGRMESLLQRPFQGAPSSLLKGDDYFLPALEQAMSTLMDGWQPTEPGDRPIDLTITTTLLRGAPKITVDSFGQRLPQVVHEGRFTFRRDDPVAAVAGAPDDFGVDGDPAARQLLARRLALAARCTASFPVAFEPVHVPATGTRLEPTNPADPGDPNTRLDMGAHADWRESSNGVAPATDRSRWCVDGGVLANTPTKAALSAIHRMPSSGPVQRVMLLVFPHAPARLDDTPADRAEAPTVTGTLSGLLGALTNQGSKTFVDQIDDHNRRAGSRGSTRADVMRTSGPEGLTGLSETLFAHYGRLRIRRAARDLATRVNTPEGWSYERIRQAAFDAQHESLHTNGRLPYLPKDLPGVDDELPSHWPWGVSAAVDVVDICLEITRDLTATTPQDPGGVLGAARAAAHASLAMLRASRATVDDRWLSVPALRSLTPGSLYWRTRLWAYDWHVGAAPSPPPPAGVGEHVLDAVRADADQGGAGVKAARAVASAVVALHALAAVAEGTAWAPLFEGIPAQAVPGFTPDIRPLYARLVRLHVASWTIGDETPTENTQPLNLVQVSLLTQNAFAVHSVTPDDKVGGTELNRFGGFLKRSWRMNDWAWGRLDAATMLARVVVSPGRVRLWHLASGVDARQVVDEVIAASFGVPVAALEPDGDVDPTPLWLALDALRKKAVKEVGPVIAAGSALADLPPSLTSLAALAAYPRHLTIALEELPVIAAAVTADRLDGANTASRGELFLAQEQTVLHALKTDAGGTTQADRLRRYHLGFRALQALDRAGIGREPLGGELGSNQMIRTAATAAGVAATVLDGPGSGFGALKPVTRAVRGFVLFPYWVLRGLASGGTVARFLALLGILTGGVMLSLSLLGVTSGPAQSVLAALGAGTGLTVFAYAALRTGTLLHGVVLLSPVAPLLAYAVQSGDADEERNRSLTVTIVVLLVALALVLLGSLPSPLRTPFAAVVDAWRSSKMRIAAMLVAAVAVAVLVVLTLKYGWHDNVAHAAARSVHWVETLDPLLGLYLALALVAVGTALALFRGRGFQVWEADDVKGHRRRRATHPMAATVGWSVVYGAIYLVAAAAIVYFVPPDNQRARSVALGTALVIALALVLVVPAVGPTIARRALTTQYVQEAKAGLVRIRMEPDETQHAALARWLVRRGRAYRYLYRGDGPAGALSVRGKSLAENLATNDAFESSP